MSSPTNSLHRRIFDISYRYKLSHLSSAITCVDIIDEIYSTKRPEDVFVLSCGHAGLAHYVCLEKHEGKDAEALYLKYRTHPTRNPKDGLHVSSGSLGCGITIALGMAMADKDRDVHCLISDGESFEGSVSETLRIKTKYQINNLRVYANFNGYSCIEKIQELQNLADSLFVLDKTVKIVDTGHLYQKYPFLNGVAAHYYNLSLQDLETISRA